jgi:hypothetical protein
MVTTLAQVKKTMIQMQLVVAKNQNWVATAKDDRCFFFQSAYQVVPVLHARQFRRECQQEEVRSSESNPDPKHGETSCAKLNGTFYDLRSTKQLANI